MSEMSAATAAAAERDAAEDEVQRLTQVVYEASRMLRVAILSDVDDYGELDLAEFAATHHEARCRSLQAQVEHLSSRLSQHLADESSAQGLLDDLRDGVRRIHHSVAREAQGDLGHYCDGCGDDWPCATFKLLRSPAWASRT